jgi:hypothetical protein
MTNIYRFDICKHLAVRLAEFTALILLRLVYLKCEMIWLIYSVLTLLHANCGSGFRLHVQTSRYCVHTLISGWLHLIVTGASRNELQARFSMGSPKYVTWILFLWEIILGSGFPQMFLIISAHWSAEKQTDWFFSVAPGYVSWVLELLKNCGLGLSPRALCFYRD